MHREEFIEVAEPEGRGKAAEHQPRQTRFGFSHQAMPAPRMRMQMNTTIY